MTERLEETHSKHPVVFFSLTQIMIFSWPLQIIARLLSAAVESHHPVALAPHVLADDPLGGVAGTSPQECYSFFQLHPADRQIKRCVFRRRTTPLALTLRVPWLISEPAGQWLFSATVTFNRCFIVLSAKAASSARFPLNVCISSWDSIIIPGENKQTKNRQAPVISKTHIKYLTQDVLV